MVKNILIYLLILVTTLYIGILNRQSWAIILFFAELILFFLQAVAVFYQRAHLVIKVDLPESSLMENEQAIAEISFQNIGYIPIQRVKIRAKYQRLSKERGAKHLRKNINIWGTIDSWDTQSYQLLANSFPNGQFLFSIPYVKLYDYFGLFSLKITLNKNRMMVVLPSPIDMPVILSGQYTLTEIKSDETKKGQDATTTYDIRKYQPGDNLRQIHWKRSASREDLLYRESAAQNEVHAVLFWKMPNNLEGLLFHYQLKIACSCSHSFLREGFFHFWVWENPLDHILERRLIQTEQDIYETMTELLKSASALPFIKRSRKKVWHSRHKKELLQLESWEDKIQCQYQSLFSDETCPEAFFLFYGELSNLSKAIILKKETEIIGEFLKGTHFFGGEQEEKQLEKELQKELFF